MRKQILVVDDDPLYLDLVRDVFDVQEIEVFAASNGSSALSILKTHNPSLIISDFDMPGMNGMEFHSQLMKDQKTKDIPFVFMTGSSDGTLSQYTKQHGLRLCNKNNLVHELLRLSKDLK
jgi:CheY-like chemotaxis protein